MDAGKPGKQDGGNGATTVKGPISASLAQGGAPTKGAAPVDVDAILKRGEGMLDPEAVAENAARWAAIAAEAEKSAEQERLLLGQLRDLYRKYPQLRNRLWCESEVGRPIVAQVEALHRAIDKIRGYKTTDPDYDFMRRHIRPGWTKGDYVEAVRLAAESLSTKVGPALVKITRRTYQARRRAGELEKFFFSVDNRILAPENYSGRPEVRRIVGALIGLRYRAKRTLEEERQQQRGLLREPLPRSTKDGGMCTAEIVSPSLLCLFDGEAAMSVFVDDLLNRVPGKTKVRGWSGVIRVKVSCVPIPMETGTAKRYEVVEAVGDIARLFPEGKRKVDLRCGEGPVRIRPDAEKVLSLPFQALIAYIQAADKELRRVQGMVPGLETKAAASDTPPEEKKRLDAKVAELKARTLDYYIGLPAWESRYYDRQRRGGGAQRPASTGAPAQAAAVAAPAAPPNTAPAAAAAKPSSKKVATKGAKPVATAK